MKIIVQRSGYAAREPQKREEYPFLEGCIQVTPSGDRVWERLLFEVVQI
jgi:hypothetical protein